jgi:DNA repair protein RecN (Recombination protein N)
MLVRLAIRDIVLIDQLDLEFAGGLSILTGETGAGKSILLDALSLALGARGDGALVRQGQAQGQVTAVFDLAENHPALVLAHERNIETDGELILRRVQLADGRTRAFVNDQPASAQMMRAISSGLVEIHGQHDERALMDASAHRTLVDAYGRLEAMADATKAAFDTVKAVESELADETARVAAAQAEADFAAHAHQELTKLAVMPGEEEALAEQRALMMQAEKVSADIREAYEGLSGEASPMPTLVAAARRLERRLSQAPPLIEPCVKALDNALDALDLATTAIEAALRAADFDPNELERAEARLFALRGMARKYSAPVAQLPALAEKYAADLAALEAGRAKVTALEKGAPGLFFGGGRSIEGAPVGCARIGKGGGRRTCAAKAGARPLHCRDIKRFQRSVGGRDRPGGVLRANQSGLSRGPIDEGGLGWRARAFHAGAEGRPRRSWLGADLGV